MLRNELSGLLAVLVLAACSQAGVIITSQGVPTVGLSGYTTYTLTATTNDGSQILGFDFASQSTYGFFGTLNQLNPAGLPTIFQDNNAFIPFFSGWDISQDSQFKFVSTNVTVPAGFSSESSSQLRAIFAAPAPLGTSVPFVQIVTNGGGITFTGQVQTVIGSVVTDNNVSGIAQTCLDCSPPHVTDETIDNVNANIPGSIHHQIQVSALNSLIMIGSFQFDSYAPAPGVSGTGPAIPAALDNTDASTYFFNWNTIGSPLGTYKWTFTAYAGGFSDDGSLTVRITAVPEPGTLVLCVISFCWSRMRRSRFI